MSRTRPPTMPPGRRSQLVLAVFGSGFGFLVPIPKGFIRLLAFELTL